MPEGPWVWGTVLSLLGAPAGPQYLWINTPSPPRWRLGVPFLLGEQGWNPGTPSDHWVGALPGCRAQRRPSASLREAGSRPEDPSHPTSVSLFGRSEVFHLGVGEGRSGVGAGSRAAQLLPNRNLWSLG